MVLAAGSSVLQQLLQDAGLLQCSEVGNVLGNNWEVLAVVCPVAFTVAVCQRTQEGVVLIGGEVIPEGGASSSAHRATMGNHKTNFTKFLGIFHNFPK